MEQRSPAEGRDGIARAYVRLGLRLGRVVPGLVDAHLGDPAVERAIADEPRVPAAALRMEAADLRRRLAAERGGDEPPAVGNGAGAEAAGAVGRRRDDHLDAQLRACEAIAAVADGVVLDVAEEVRRCLGVEIAPGDPDRYREAHGRLAEVLGCRPRELAAVVGAFRERDRVPLERLRPGVAAMIDALRERTAATVGLPAGEHLDLEVVTGVPWAGFSRRVRRGRSVMAVSSQAGHRMSHLPLLTAHEAYPGHHTEAVRTELRGPGEPQPPERTLLLARTPQSLVAEGVAELGLQVVVGPGWGAWSATRLAAAGLPTTPGTGALGEAVEEAMDPLAAVRQDAALILHGGRAVDRHERAHAHLRRWLLVDDDRARRMLEFLAHPRWRIHTTTYVEGVRLVRPWLDARPATESAGARFARLLDGSFAPDTLRREAAVAPL